jgi:cytochrome c oxidase subunit I
MSISHSHETEAHSHELGFLRKYIFSEDHKVIGIQFLFSGLIFLFIGGALAMLVRLQVGYPNGVPILSYFFPKSWGDKMSPEFYTMLFSMHASVMIFFVIIPLLTGSFGNFLIPLMIGAKDMAFPKLNMCSYWFMWPGFIVIVASFFVDGGGAGSGWTSYPTLASVMLGPGQGWNSPASPHSGLGQVFWLIALLCVGISSMMGSINYVTTIINMRAPGMTLFRMPLTVWSLFITAILQAMALPVLTVALILQLLDKTINTTFFLPPGGLEFGNLHTAAGGGQPLLWQHVFWFYSHPAVYIMILPAMGVLSELIPAFARKRIFGYRFVAYASLAIAAIGFFVWGHHMFIAGESYAASMLFSLLSFMVSVPSAVKVYNWCATLHKGDIMIKTPLLYAVGAIVLFVMGGLTGLLLASLAIDIQVHDTYFVVAHFHYIMVGATVMAYLGALHYWWPKITGRLYHEVLGQISALLIFVGFNITFFPQFLLGYLGMPRRYHAYPPELQVLNVLSSAGASILAIGYLFPLAYLVWSFFAGARAPANPWNAKGLEWTTASPPPTHNFGDEPIVIEEPYDYPNATVET